MADQRCVQVRISGRVQGVSFRAWTERRARALGLSGWVRNLGNGEVEAAFSGPRESVDTILRACREGPRLARVAKIEIVAECELLSGPFMIRGDA